MQKTIIAMVGIFALSMFGGCQKAKSPDAVANDVTNAEQKAANNVADAQKDASKNVADAAGKVDGKAKDLDNAEVKGAYEVEMAKAEGDRRIALNKCEALSGDAQRDCKNVADADYQAEKAQLKAMRNAEKQ
jgi:hypothetical protein